MPVSRKELLPTFPFLFSNPFVQMNVFLVGSDSRTGALYGERGSRTALGRNDNALNDAV